jgi:hypothetical protein
LLDGFEVCCIFEAGIGVFVVGVGVFNDVGGFE